jgi:hypothetical protein
MSAIVLTTALLPACTSTARVGQFREFADVGVAYVDAADAFLEEAGDAAIDADSHVLMVARERLPDSAERGKDLVESNRLLSERLGLLSDLRLHGHLLRAYFLALAALAESDSPTEIGAATAEIVTSLGALDDEIRRAKVGDREVGDFSGAVVEIAVAGFRRAALERELEAHASTIERELDLQQAAMRAIGEQLRTDLEVVLAGLETTEIVRPFRGTRQLPRRWATSRREILKAAVSVESADAAADAATELKASFVKLVEDRLGISDLQSLIGDIDRVLELIESVARPEAS